jgi:hypothetical protein
MEEMIARWIRETKFEYDKAKRHQNVFKMVQMKKLEFELKYMRKRLT